MQTGGKKMDWMRASALQNSPIYPSVTKQSGAAENMKKIAAHQHEQAHEYDDGSYISPLDIFTPTEGLDITREAPLPDSNDVKIPFELNQDDCYKSRALKSEYSNNMNLLKEKLEMAEQLNQEMQGIQNYVNGEGETPQGISHITQDGDYTTVRVQDVINGMSLNGQPNENGMNNHWIDYTYSTDGSYMAKTEHNALSNGETQDIMETLTGNTYDEYMNGDHYGSFTAEDSEHMTLTSLINGKTTSLDGTKITSDSPKGTSTYNVNEDGDVSATKSGGIMETAFNDGSYQQSQIGEDGKTIIDKTVAPGAGPDAEHNMAYYDNLAKQMGSAVDGDGNATELTNDQQYLLGQSLTAFQPNILEKLQDSGVQYMMFDDKNSPPGGYPFGPYWPEGKGGNYSKERNIVSLRSSDFENGGNRLTDHNVHHETGHSIDDVLINDIMSSFGQPQFNMRSDVDPQFADMYNSFVEGTADGTHQNWSNYAKTNKHEYFAEGVAYYVGTNNEKEKLRQQDPDLFNYMEQLFTNQLADPNLVVEDKDAKIPYSPL